MDVTRKCDYACRMLRALSVAPAGYLSVAQMAESEGIPYAFARAVQRDLTQAGLIETARGAKGGVRLVQDLAPISMLEVVEAIQGPVSVSACTQVRNFCADSPTCSFNKLWAGANSVLADYFSRVSVSELLEKGAEHPVIAEALKGAAPCRGQ